MAFDENLAERVRNILSQQKGVTEKKMFGGLTFMLKGNMCCGVEKRKLMVRVGTDNYPEILSQAHTAPMDFTGRPLKGMIYVKPSGLETEQSLSYWVDMAVAFVKTLPEK